MSKFMKVLATLLLILFIATGLATFIPTLAGITTVVVQDGMESNQKIGSITYAADRALSGLSAGDKIIITDAESAYIYKVKSISSDWKSIETVADEDNNKASETIEINGTAQKVLFTLPLVGYFSIAMGSMEGIIILGLIFAFIIMLYIAASVWDKVRNYQDDEDDDKDDEFYTDLTRKKVKTDIQEEREFQHRREQKRREKEEEAPKEQPTRRIELDESVEELPKEIKEVEEPLPEIAMPDYEASELAKQSIKADPETLAAESFEKSVAAEAIPAAAPEAKPESKFGHTDNITNIQDAIAVALETPEQGAVKETTAPIPASAEEEEIPDEIELAMPAKTLDELLTEAYVAGDDPKVSKDEVTGIDFVDFSDCL